MEISNPESPIRELYKHLASKKPFERPLFSSAADGDEVYFHQTADVQRIISLFEASRKSDTAMKGKRLLGVYSNFGDGKTTLLGFLRYLKGESVLPIFIDGNGVAGIGSESADPSRPLLTLIWNLLYTLKERKLIEEKVYNTATVEFKGADSEAARSQVIQEQMRLVYRNLGSHYLVWLCDNVGHRSCLQAFQQLLDLRDPEPPAPHFFSGNPVLIAFSTSEMDLIKAWKEDPNRDAAGHKLELLGVRAEDMFQIIRQVLDASFKELPEDLRQRAAELRQGNPVFPINADDLDIFLQAKAKRERLEQARNEVILEVAEIQLRNTLRLLQRLVDAHAMKGCDCLIDLRVLMKEDLGS